MMPFNMRNEAAFVQGLYPVKKSISKSCLPQLGERAEVWPNKDNSKGLSASKLDGDGSVGGYKVGSIRNLPLLFYFFRVKWSLHNDLIQILTELVVLYF